MAIPVGFRGSPPVPQPGEFEIAALSDSCIAALQDSVLGWYLYRGYPFASLACYLPTDDGLALSVVPGRHASLEEVRIAGLEDTRPEVLIRYLRADPGGPYDPVPLERWRSRLQRLDFMDWVGPYSLYMGPGGNLVVIQEVVEGPAGSLAASLGFAQSGESSLEGSGLLKFTNLLGTGRQLEIAIAKSRWGGTDVSGRYLEPWIFGVPLSAEISFAQEVPDSGWLNREAELKLIWEMSEGLEVSAGAGVWRGYEPFDVSRRYGYGIAGFEWNPGRRVRQGWQGLDSNLEGRLGNLTGPDSSEVLSTADLTIRADLFSGLLGFGGDFMAGGVIQGQILESRLERIGGQQTLRGYAEDAWRASRYAIARPEISVGETETRLYGFFDVTALDTPEGFESPCGAGGGLRGSAGPWVVDAAIGVPLTGGPARFYLSAVAEVL
jgi:hypothetical protein